MTTEPHEAPDITHQVYTDYDGHHPPNHPGETWTRFVCISDTHSKTKWPWIIPDGDVLIHAGDLCRDGNLFDLELTMSWLRRLPHPHKVIIAGNHDLCLDSTWAKSRRHRDTTGISLADVEQAQLTVTDDAATEAGIHYLEHEAVSITTSPDKTWKFYGSPAAPRYASGAFQYRTATEADQIYKRIPSDTEILLTHTPPYGIQDETLKGVHAGCPHLRATMDTLSSCRLHVFGHIHEGHGVDINRIGPENSAEQQKEKESRAVPHGNRVSVNAAIAWGGQPIIVDLMNEPFEDGG